MKILKNRIFCFNTISSQYKNSVEVNITPALGEITTACNVGQAKPGHGACMKSMSRTNTGACLKCVLRTTTMQGFKLPAINAVEKFTIFLDSTYIF